MANPPNVSTQVRQQLEEFTEKQERELLQKIYNTIDRMALIDLFDDGSLQSHAVGRLILHVEVFVERIFDFSLSLELGQPAEQVASDAVSRAVFVLYNLAGSFRKFGLPQEPAQKYKALEGRNADLFLPNLMERLEAELASKVKLAPPPGKHEISGRELDTYGPELPELEFSRSARQDPGFSSCALAGRAEQIEAATTDESTLRHNPDPSDLPALTPEAQRRLELSVLVAGESLQDEILACWSRYFPPEVSRVRALEPELFFQAFSSYGTAVYDAYATALLARTDYLDYAGLLNNNLKTNICNRLAPLRHEGEWQRSLLATWRLFDHPRHSELQRSALEVVDAFDDAVMPYWRRFVDSLHKTISRRTRRWLREWKRVHLDPESEEQTRPPVDFHQSEAIASPGQDTSAFSQNTAKDEGRCESDARGGQKRGRPTKISDERKRQALSVRGGKARAQILYDTKYPTREQITNSYGVLRHFQRRTAE